MLLSQLIIAREGNRKAEKKGQKKREDQVTEKRYFTGS